MSARIERGRVQLLTRTGLDWSDKYPSVVEALAKVRAAIPNLQFNGHETGDGELIRRHAG
jgi:ATP-dependent DNA ligase